MEAGGLAGRGLVAAILDRIPPAAGRASDARSPRPRPAPGGPQLLISAPSYWEAAAPLGRSRDVRVELVLHLPDFIVSSSSASRSIDSSAPSCMPEATMPSRSITDWNTWCATSLVLLPNGSNVAVCRATCPGTPSYSNVAQIRSGATTSWLTPWNPCSDPSAPRCTTLHSPPGRESNLSILTS